MDAATLTRTCNALTRYIAFAAILLSLLFLWDIGSSWDAVAVLMAVWFILPYVFVLLLRAWATSRWRALSLLTALLLMIWLGYDAYILGFMRSTDAQAALILLIAPTFQLVPPFLVALAFAVARAFQRLASRRA